MHFKNYGAKIKNTFSTCRESCTCFIFERRSHGFVCFNDLKVELFFEISEAISNYFCEMSYLCPWLRTRIKDI